MRLPYTLVLLLGLFVAPFSHAGQKDRNVFDAFAIDSGDEEEQDFIGFSLSSVPYAVAAKVAWDSEEEERNDDNIDAFRANLALLKDEQEKTQQLTRELFKAVKNTQVREAKRLLEAKADVHAVDGKGRTPLLRAAQHTCVETLMAADKIGCLLLEHGAHKDLNPSLAATVKTHKERLTKKLLDANACPAAKGSKNFQSIHHEAQYMKKASEVTQERQKLQMQKNIKMNPADMETERTAKRIAAIYAAVDAAAKRQGFNKKKPHSALKYQADQKAKAAQENSW